MLLAEVGERPSIRQAVREFAHAILSIQFACPSEPQGRPRCARNDPHSPSVRGQLVITDWTT